MPGFSMTLLRQSRKCMFIATRSSCGFIWQMTCQTVETEKAPHRCGAFLCSAIQHYALIRPIDSSFKIT
jgi:hypothetical protein